MRRAGGCALLALALALQGCTQNSVPASSSAAPQDWVARAAATVRVSDDSDDVRDCEFVSMLDLPGGWDGVLEHMSAEEQVALQAMKVATVRAGGNFVLLYPGAEASGEAYLCTE